VSAEVKLIGVESVLRFITPPAACEFLPGRFRRMEYDVVRLMTPGEYTVRMQEGWRRFGHAMFRPACGSCRMCQSLRIPVAAFHPDRSQSRAWKANADAVRIVVGDPVLTADKQALFDKFHDHQHQVRGWPRQTGEETASFVDNPFPTEEWSFYVAERLVAVGYVDRLPEALSAMYFFYDPDERHRSLGTFNVLSVIAAARARSVPYVYLGYYVDGCRSLEYKARFRPNEVLATDGNWVSFRG
jgi:arginyl-tRNA--protein-N-Asp/Glu arginylyltransferase